MKMMENIIQHQAGGMTGTTDTVTSIVEEIIHLYDERNRDIDGVHTSILRPICLLRAKTLDLWPDISHLLLGV